MSSTDSCKLIDGVALGNEILRRYSRTLDSAGRLPIYKAVFSGRDKAVKELLSYGFKVDSKVVVRAKYVRYTPLFRSFVDVAQLTIRSDEIKSPVAVWSNALNDNEHDVDDDDYGDDDDDDDYGDDDDDDDYGNDDDDDEFDKLTRATTLWICLRALGHDNDDSDDDYDSYSDSGYGFNRFIRTTLLWTASVLGHTEVVRVLADAGARLDRRTAGIPALVAAACNGHTEIVRLLIEKGANVDSRNGNDETALYISAENGFIDIVTYLVDAGADINVRGMFGHSLISISSRYGNIDLVKYFIKAGVDLNASDPDNACMFDRVSYSPLTHAIYYSHGDIVKCLVDAGASCNVYDPEECSPLVISSICGHVEITEFLINAGANIYDGGKSGEETALMAAFYTGYADVFEVLLAAGAAKGVERSEFIKGLKHSISAGHDELIQLVAGILAEDCRNDVCGRDSMLTCTIDPETIGNTDSLRMALILIKGCNVRLMNAQSYLVFRDAVDYSVFDQTLHLAHAVSLPCDIHLTLPQVSELIQCPGIGSVSSISGKAIEVTGHIKEIVHEIVRDVNGGSKSAFTEVGLATMKACGSAAEGTKVGLPVEFDYSIRYFPRNPGEIVDFKDGYKFYETRDTSSEESVLFGRGSQSFHDRFSQCLFDDDNMGAYLSELSSPNLTVRGGGQANTEIAMDWLENETGNKLLVSVDLVPVLFFKNEWPEYLTQRTWMMDKETLRSRGFALVAKPPHKKSALAQEISEEDRVKLWRISCPHLETEHIACLEPRVKDAYIAAKCVRDPEVCRILLRESNGIIHNVEKHIPSYLLKTVFLHNVEDFLRSDRSLIEMVYIIYSDLEYCLSRGFLPLFWQHDVNTLAGLRVDPRKALRATKLMKEFVGRMCLKETDCDELSESGERRKQHLGFEQLSGDKDEKEQQSGDLDETKQYHRREHSDEVTVYSRRHPQLSGTKDLGKYWTMLFEGVDEAGPIGNERTVTCMEEVLEVTIYSRSLPIPKPVVYYAFTETGEPHPDVYKYDLGLTNIKVFS